MKKLFLLSMLICLSVVARAADVVIDGIFYNLSQQDKTAEVTSNPNKYSGEVIIPSSITFDGIKYSVTKIGGWAFLDCKSLTSIVIPESVTFICNRAFMGCSGLTALTIGNNVTSIDENAFWGCSGLTSAVIPNSVTWIGPNAFFDCNSLVSLTIGNNVSSIDEGAFRNCSSLTSVTIPNSVTIIREYAFFGCNSLNTITIGVGLTRIADKAFASCPELSVIYCFAKNAPISPYGSNSDLFKNTPIANATLYVPASSLEHYKASIPWYEFGSIEPLDYIDGIYYNFNEDEAEVTYLNESYNSYSGDIDIPASVTTVWGETFSVTGIGEYAFKNCHNLASVTIPNSVKSIGTASFDGCI